MKIEDFALSYGPSGQPLGQIIDNGHSVLLTTADGAITYEIDTSAGSDFVAGLITVQDVSSGLYPLFQGGVGIKDDAGVFANPSAATLEGYAISDDGTTLTAYYSQATGSTTRSRSHIFSVVGSAVRIEIESVDGSTAVNGNYSGVYCGVFSGTGLAILEAAGTLTAPTAYATSGGNVLWLGHFLDITQSHASSFTLTTPASGNPGVVTYSTLDKYSANTAGELQAPLKEVLWCIASTVFENCLIHPNDGLKNAESVAADLWCFITSKGAGWASHETAITSLADDWGFDNLIVYPQWWWATPNFTTSSQDNGSSWAAGDEAAQASFGAACRARGFDVGVYSYNSLEKEGTANYNTADRVLNTDGTPRQSIWGATTYLRKSENTFDKFFAQFQTLAPTLGLNKIRYDVDTYAAPTGGGGNHIDMDAGSPAGTLKGAIQERRRWMYQCKDAVGRSRAAAYGEGARSSHMSDFEMLYAGALDGTHTWWNTNAGKDESDALYPADRSISNWPMIVENAWHVVNQYFQHTNNNPARFFTVDDSGLQSTPPGPASIYPYSQEMLDRQRCYSFLLKRTGAIYLTSDWSAFFPHSEVIKEYYLVNAACRAMEEQRGQTPTIEYHSDTYGYERLNSKFVREGREGFVKTRVRIRVGSVTIYVNRSATDWVIPGILDAAGITLTTDGYFMQNKEDYFGSFKSGLTGNVRADIANKAGEFILVDGRGSAVTFLGITPPNGLMQLIHRRKGFTLTEQVDETIVRS